MARTLRNWEAAFPYLGDRGDVSDAQVIDDEEAYGDKGFGAISDKVVNDMFGYARRPVVPPPMHPAHTAPRPRVAAAIARAGDPRAAALDGWRWLGKSGWPVKSPKRTSWDTHQSTWQVSVPLRPRDQAMVERPLIAIAQRHNVHLFRVTPRRGGPQTFYAFSSRPRAIPRAAKLGGMSAVRLTRAY